MIIQVIKSFVFRINYRINVLINFFFYMGSLSLNIHKLEDKRKREILIPICHFHLLQKQAGINLEMLGKRPWSSLV